MKVDINDPNCFLQCCIDDNEEMLKLLLEFGANVNAEGE